MPTPNEDILELDLTRKSETIKIKDPKTGEVKVYTLKEMSGLERDQWMNKMSKSFKLGADGKSTGIADYTGIHYILISRCLYDDTDKLISEQIISQWPASAQKILFDKCQKLNGLGEDAEEEAKKD